MTAAIERRRHAAWRRRIALVAIGAGAASIGRLLLRRRAVRGASQSVVDAQRPDPTVARLDSITTPAPVAAPVADDPAIVADTAAVVVEPGPGGAIHPAGPVADPGPAHRIADHGTRRGPIVLWLAAYAFAVLAPFVLILASGQGAPRTFMLELGSALGIAALSLLALQLALPARLPLLADIGAEVAVRLHRRLADIMLAVVVAHVAAVMVADPKRLELLRFFGEPWRAQAAIGSVAALLVLFFTSMARRRIRLSYAGWRGVHLVTGALALVLAVVHTIGVNRYLVRAPAEWMLVGLTVAGLGALVVLRARWLRRGSVRPYFVDEVITERGGAVTLALHADGHAGQQFIPGQFAWLKLGAARSNLAEHPFSYSSSAEDPRHPRFTMQPRAGFSARAIGFDVGTRLFVDGPHGAFRPRASSRGTVLIAGGIGITPSISILRTAADRRDGRHYVLFYGTRTVESMAFIDELLAMTTQLDLTVVPVLSQPDPDWSGERGRISAGVLDRHLPKDITRWEFMICGSGQFVDSAVEALETVGVPGEKVHAERFVDI